MPGFDRRKPGIGLYFEVGAYVVNGLIVFGKMDLMGKSGSG